MFKLSAPIINSDDKNLPIIKKLLKEVFGYTDEEIQQFVNTDFLCDVAKHLTLEQVRLIVQPFQDNNVCTFPILIDEESGKFLSYKGAGLHIEKQLPKDHYYDEPVVSRDQLVNPFTQKEIERQQNLAKRRAEDIVRSNTTPTVTCPYCHSTRVSRISILGRIVSVEFWGLASNKLGKQWHCDDCGSNF